MTTRTITLISKDGDHIQVDYEIAACSKLISEMLSDEESETDVPLPNISTEMLKKVIKFCEIHVQTTGPKITGPLERPLKSNNIYELFPRDYADYINKVINKDDKYSELFELIQAFNYLDFMIGLEVTTATTASLIKGKTPEEIKELFGINSDQTHLDLVNATKTLSIIEPSSAPKAPKAASASTNAED